MPRDQLPPASSRRLGDRRLAMFTAALIVAVASAVISAPKAAYAIVDTVVCAQGDYVINQSPGLNNTVRPYTLSGGGNLRGCISTIPGSNGNAAFSVTGGGTGSCTSGFTVNLEVVLTWADGATSQASGSATLTIVLGIPTAFTATGGIVGGRFANGIAVALPTFAFANPADCFTPGGVTTTTGGITLFTII